MLDFQANPRHCPGLHLIDVLLAFPVLSFYLRPLWNEGVKSGRIGKAVLCFMVFFGPGNVVATAHSGEEGNLSFYGLLWGMGWNSEGPEEVENPPSELLSVQPA